MHLNVADKKHVFINWDLVEAGYGVAWKGAVTSSEMPYGVRIAVHPPRVDPQPLVWPDRPWESLINVYSTLIEDGGLYRLYYEPHSNPIQDQPSDLKAMLAYAESSDGVNWTKPTVGTVCFQGSTDNNLVYGLDLSQGRGAHGATVFLDPGAPADERYKLVHMGREQGVDCVFGAVSPDGRRWTPVQAPLLRDYMSDTQTVVSYDRERGRYVGYFRGWTGREPGQYHGRRTIAYAETEDFYSWPAPQTIVTLDGADDPGADIYTNAYTRWPGAANAHLMFPAIYERSLDALHVHTMLSRDGVSWERPRRTPILTDGEPGSHWEGGVYAGCGLIGASTNEWSLPIGPKWHTHNQGHFAEGRPENPPDRGYLCPARWRADGFTSLEAEIEGRCTTVPMVYEGSRLQLNAWTRFAGEVRVELCTMTGQPIEGRTFADCDRIMGDAPRRIVTWQGNADLSTWAGLPVRMRFFLRRARLHAFQFIR